MFRTGFQSCFLYFICFQSENISQGLQKLGVEKWIAHKVANWGDHYQFVATKSVVARAISKEILTKRGLVSIFDYYQKVAHI